MTLKHAIGFAVALSALTFGAAAKADLVTFDDAAGNAILDQQLNNGQSFSDQGLSFTNNGQYYMYVWDGTSPNGNGTNANIFAGFADGDSEVITHTGGGTFNLLSFDMAISWYDPNASETILVNGVPLTITTTLTTYTLNLMGVNSVTITGVGSDTGYWLLDNLNFTTDVPEPSTIALFGAGLAAAGAFRLRRKTTKAA